MVAWLGSEESCGQSIYSGMRVPVQAIQRTAAEQQMVDFPGYIPSGTQVDPLSHYQRSRLGRWEVAKEVEPDDSVFGIQLATPVGPMRIRFEATINGKPFRAAREQAIDELLAIGKGRAKDSEKDDAQTATEAVIDKKSINEADVNEVVNNEASNVEENAKEETEVAVDTTEPEEESVANHAFAASPAKDRMVAYAQSRGDRLTRHELRGRVADIAGGPALLRTTNDFGSRRHETLTLFAFLDADEDGAISPQERSVAVKALNDRDANSDGRLDWNELQSGLKDRTTRRKTDSAVVDWKSWDAKQSRSIEDLRVAISFGDEEDNPGLTIDECNLDEPWGLVTAEARRADSEKPDGAIILASQPKFAVALCAAQSVSNMDEETDQISIGVALESNALFRCLDQNGDWSLSVSERSMCSEAITSLDKNADGTLAVGELPILLRVCVSRGATAHQFLADSISIVPQLNKEKEQFSQAAPAWFTSMDRDGNRTLTRKEFIGKPKSFSEIDTDQNDLLSVEEVLATQSD